MLLGDVYRHVARGRLALILGYELCSLVEDSTPTATL